jgi:hypothetical protein
VELDKKLAHTSLDAPCKDLKFTRYSQSSGKKIQYAPSNKSRNNSYQQLL